MLFKKIASEFLTKQFKDKFLSFIKDRNNIGRFIIIYLIYRFYTYFKNKKNKLAELLYLIPYFNNTIKQELKLQSNKLETSLMNYSYKNYDELPYIPVSVENLNKKLDVFKVETKDTQSKLISGVVYSHNDIDDKVCEFYKRFSKTNPLHADLYPSIRMMEIDIINICKSLYCADDKACGSLTSGGTESIVLACFAYRDYCKEKFNVENPNIIGFTTIHPAFDKACHYFNIKLIKVKNVKEMKSNINGNTICLVASAPDYPYGIVDPIREVNKLAVTYSKNFHVDACMGGFLLPFLDEFSYINFKLKGISSISMDTHKYGYAPKGSSVLLFKDANIKKYQHFINKEWCGGVYATPTILGSKSGGIIAGTWASLLLRGKSEFNNYSKKINENLKFLVNKIKSIDNINIVGNPKLNIIAVASDKLNMYLIINKMKQKGWSLSVMQNPPAFHFCVTDVHTREICERLYNDLLDCTNEVSKSDNNDKLEGTLAIYGAENNLEKGLFIDEIINDYIFLLSQQCISYRHK